MLPPPEEISSWADGIQIGNQMLDLLDKEGVLDVKLLDAIIAEFPTTRESPNPDDEQA